MGIEKSVVINSIENAGLKSNVRPEQLSMEQFIAFAECLKELV